MLRYVRSESGRVFRIDHDVFPGWLLELVDGKFVELSSPVFGDELETASSMTDAEITVLLEDKS